MRVYFIESMRNTCNQIAFTLLELLVVIAIIALLASMTAAALHKSRQSAQQVRCLSNLRQLGLAAHMYWDDNGGNCFRYRGISTNNGDIYWFGWLGRGSESTRPFDFSKGALFPYLTGKGIEICPSLNYAMASFKLKATGASYGYGYNLTLSSALEQPSFNINRAIRPADLALFADCAQVNTFQLPATPENPMLEEFYYFSTNEPTVHFRHRQKSNVVFCDGHTAAEVPLKGSEDLRLRGEVVGRVRDEIVTP